MNIFGKLLSILETRKKELEEEIGTGFTGGGNDDNETEYECVISIEEHILKEKKEYDTRNRWEDREGN